MWFWLTVILGVAGFLTVVFSGSPAAALGLVVLAGLCLFKYLKVRVR